MTHKTAWTGTAAAALLLVETSAFAQMGPASGYGNSQQSTMGSAPYATPSSPSMAGPQIPLTDVSDTNQLASASVKDAYGQKVGQVRAVKKSASGRPTSLDIALTTATAQGKVVNVKASNLKFDPANKIVIAQLSSSELDTMPSASSASQSTMSTPANTSSQPTGSSY
jgi:hypothetical protein